MIMKLSFIEHFYIEMYKWHGFLSTLISSIVYMLYKNIHVVYAYIFYTNIIIRILPKWWPEAQFHRAGKWKG